MLRVYSYFCIQEYFLRAQGLCGVLGNEPKSVSYKASVLATVLSLWLLSVLMLVSDFKTTLAVLGDSPWICAVGSMLERHARSCLQDHMVPSSM